MMHFMDSFNQFAGKRMPFIVILCLAAGILFSGTLGKLIFLVPYAFAFMTFTGALNSSVRQLYDVTRHPLPLLATFVIVHVVIPVLALGAGKLLFRKYPDFITGIFLEYVVPTAVVSVMWCTMTGGNISLSLCILLVDTLAAPFVLPFSLHVLVGSQARIDIYGIMREMLWMVAVPAVLTLVLNLFTKDRAGKKLSPLMAPYGKIALIFIITVNSTRVAPFIYHMTIIQVEVALLILALAAFGYTAGWLFSILLRQDQGVAISMTFGCGMRNISAGAVVAAAYFPAAVMFPVMIGTLFQQALASLFSHWLMKRYHKAVE